MWPAFSFWCCEKALKLKRKNNQTSGVFFKPSISPPSQDILIKFSLTFQLMPLQVIRGGHTAFLDSTSLLEIPLQEILTQSPGPLLAAGSDTSLQHEKQRERLEGQLLQFKMNSRRACSKPMPTTDSRVKTWVSRGCMCSYSSMGTRADFSVFSLCFLQSVMQVDSQLLCHFRNELVAKHCYASGQRI